MSYNALFGLGTHSVDASLEGWWKLQETTGTTAADSSGNGLSGTINGMGANPVTAAGPTNWLTSAFDFDGTDDRIEVADNAGLSGHSTQTILSRVRADSTTSNRTIARKGAVSATNLEYLHRIASSAFSAGNHTSATVVNAQGTASTATWYNFASRYNGSNIQSRVNKSTIGSSSAQTGTIADYTRPLDIGCYFQTGTSTYIDFFDGRIADISIFSRSLSDAECDQWEDGPEPINTVAPAMTGTQTENHILTSTSGTWNSQSNGTATYSYQWTRSNDGAGTGEADIGGATASTYTLVAGDVGKFIRCRVRATNDGGFDSAADTNSNMSSSIAAASGGGWGFRRRPRITGA